MGSILVILCSIKELKGTCTLFLILQGQHDELEKKFFEERAALEAKYQKLYEPLYTKVL